MKKAISLFLLGILFIILVVIGLSVQNDDKEETSKNKQDEKVQKEDKESYLKTRDTDIGIFGIVDKKDELGIEKESGDMELNITKIEIGKLEVGNEHVEEYGKERVPLIMIDVEVENTGKDKINYYPNQSVISTGGKERKENVDLNLTEDVGGKFKQDENKKGKVYFVIQEEKDDLEKVTIYIDGATDEEFKRVGDDLEIQIDL